MLAVTNLILHDIDAPNLIHDNSLTQNVRDISDGDKADIIAMNPPYGGVEGEGIQANFPSNMQTRETADLFMAMIMYRLRKNGRAGVILPDGFLFGTDSAKISIKKKLLDEFNLHTIIRLPAGVFAPYTTIKTNILFFENNGTTDAIDYFEVPLPETLKNGFSKTRPFRKTHLESAQKWFFNRNSEELNSYTVSKEEVVDRNFNLDIKNPVKSVEEEAFTLPELMKRLNTNSKEIQSLIHELDDVLKQGDV